MSLGLQHFLLRAQSLKLFREALRSVRQAPPHARGACHCPFAIQFRADELTKPPISPGELREAVRHAMEGGRGATTSEEVKFLLSEGKLQLKKLNDMLGLALLASAEDATSAGPVGGGGCGHKH
jgi:hypothetical protein